ncbi:hypothetical protein TRFO_04499 [Tritrichomonas foetus]|uniref:GAF domain-containing protein n=1 Tax=Tritrichomonas foetus TaxID=1144522 RepID=A0A1J4KJC0_9EUKA|nr:hypothetical protein TRFO_04499 [Tritrichomonas foetus]|eukprot:OHT09445.1 hypothetical protein TRFO_04499 [Tritrichomonas foetus]
MHYGIDPRSTGKKTRQPAIPSHSPADSRSTIQQWRSKANSNPYTLPKVGPLNGASTLNNIHGHNEGRAKSKSSMMAQGAQLSPLLPSDEINSIFDRMCAATFEVPLHIAVEAATNELVKIKKCLLWVSLPSQKILYSPTISKLTSYKSSIIGAAYQQNTIINCDKPAMNNNYDLLVDDPNLPTMYCPLEAKDHTVLGVIQLFNDKPFTDYHLKTMKMFLTKFTFYAHMLFNNEFKDEITSDLFVLGDKKNVIQQLIQQLKGYFKCRDVGFYSMSPQDQTFYQYDLEKGDFEQLQETAGAVSFVLKNKVPLNLPNVIEAPQYCPFVDGKKDESFLALPVSLPDESVAIVLRGKSGSKSFSSSDFSYLNSVIPVISKSICLACEQGETQLETGSSNMEERLRALLSVAECLSGVMDLDILIPTIMEKACSLLNTERCSLFIVDTVKQELVSCFQGGLDKRIRIPMNRGIVGHTATKGTIVNIADAYNDPRFDSSIDIKTGFKTRNLLTVPIYNNRGEIAGVTEMINKQDGDAFDEDAGSKWTFVIKSSIFIKCIT